MMIAASERQTKPAALGRYFGNKKLKVPKPGRSTAQVIVAGTQQQVEEAVDAAEPLREQLTERGVLIVPLPIFDEGGNGSSPKSLTPEDMRSSSHCK